MLLNLEHYLYFATLLYTYLEFPFSSRMPYCSNVLHVYFKNPAQSRRGLVWILPHLSLTWMWAAWRLIDRYIFHWEIPVDKQFCFIVLRRLPVLQLLQCKTLQVHRTAVPHSHWLKYELPFIPLQIFLFSLSDGNCPISAEGRRKKQQSVW